MYNPFRLPMDRKSQQVYNDYTTPDAAKWEELAKLSSELTGERVCWWLDQPNGVILHGRFVENATLRPTHDVCEYANAINVYANDEATVMLRPRKKKEDEDVVDSEYEWKQLDATVHFEYISIDMSAVDLKEAWRTPVAAFKSLTLDTDRNKWYRVEKITDKHFSEFEDSMFRDPRGEIDKSLVKLNLRNNLGLRESWTDGVTITLPLKDEYVPPFASGNMTRFLCISDEFVTVRAHDSRKRTCIKLLTNYADNPRKRSIKYAMTYPPNLYRGCVTGRTHGQWPAGGVDTYHDTTDIRRVKIRIFDSTDVRRGQASYEDAQTRDKHIVIGGRSTHRLYAALGLPTNASCLEISTAARRELGRLSRPADSEYKEFVRLDATLEVKRAERILLDPALKAKYDMEGDWVRYGGQLDQNTRFQSMMTNPCTLQTSP